MATSNKPLSSYTLNLKHEQQPTFILAATTAATTTTTNNNNAIHNSKLATTTTTIVRSPRNPSCTTAANIINSNSTSSTTTTTNHSNNRYQLESNCSKYHQHHSNHQQNKSSINNNKSRTCSTSASATTSTNKQHSHSSSHHSSHPHHHHHHSHHNNNHHYNHLHQQHHNHNLHHHHQSTTDPLQPPLPLPLPPPQPVARKTTINDSLKHTNTTTTTTTTKKTSQPQSTSNFPFSSSASNNSSSTTKKQQQKQQQQPIKQSHNSIFVANYSSSSSSSSSSSTLSHSPSLSPTSLRRHHHDHHHHQKIMKSMTIEEKGNKPTSKNKQSQNSSSSTLLNGLISTNTSSLPQSKSSSNNNEKTSTMAIANNKPECVINELARLYGSRRQINTTNTTTTTTINKNNNSTTTKAIGNDLKEFNEKVYFNRNNNKSTQKQQSSSSSSTQPPSQQSTMTINGKLGQYAPVLNLKANEADECNRINYIPNPQINSFKLNNKQPEQQQQKQQQNHHIYNQQQQKALKNSESSLIYENEDFLNNQNTNQNKEELIINPGTIAEIITTTTTPTTAGTVLLSLNLADEQSKHLNFYLKDKNTQQQQPQPLQQQSKQESTTIPNDEIIDSGHLFQQSDKSLDSKLQLVANYKKKLLNRPNSLSSDLEDKIILARPKIKKEISQNQKTKLKHQKKLGSLHKEPCCRQSSLSDLSSSSSSSDDEENDENKNKIDDKQLGVRAGVEEEEEIDNKLYYSSNIDLQDADSNNLNNLYYYYHSQCHQPQEQPQQSAFTDELNEKKTTTTKKNINNSNNKEEKASTSANNKLSSSKKTNKKKKNFKRYHHSSSKKLSNKTSKISTNNTTNINKEAVEENKNKNNNNLELTGQLDFYLSSISSSSSSSSSSSPSRSSNSSNSAATTSKTSSSLSFNSNLNKKKNNNNNNNNNNCYLSKSINRSSPSLQQPQQHRRCTSPNLKTKTTKKLAILQQQNEIMKRQAPSFHPEKKQQRNALIVESTTINRDNDHDHDHEEDKEDKEDSSKIHFKQFDRIVEDKVKRGENNCMTAAAAAAAAAAILTDYNNMAKFNSINVNNKLMMMYDDQDPKSSMLSSNLLNLIAHTIQNLNNNSIGTNMNLAKKQPLLNKINPKVADVDDDESADPDSETMQTKVIERDERCGIRSNLKNKLNHFEPDLIAAFENQKPQRNNHHHHQTQNHSNQQTYSRSTSTSSISSVSDQHMIIKQHQNQHQQQPQNHQLQQQNQHPLLSLQAANHNRSVALSYYHHLFNQKTIDVISCPSTSLTSATSSSLRSSSQKETNTNSNTNNNNSLLINNNELNSSSTYENHLPTPPASAPAPPLYKFVYRFDPNCHRRRALTKLSMMNRDRESGDHHHRMARSACSMHRERFENDNFITEEKNQQQHRNQYQHQRGVSSSAAANAHPSSSAAASMNSTKLSSSLNRKTSSEIKHVKFKNYGLHKSLGEDLNRLSSSLINESGVTSSSYRGSSCVSSNQHHQRSVSNNATLQTRIRKGCSLNNNGSLYGYDDDDDDANDVMVEDDDEMYSDEHRRYYTAAETATTRRGSKYVSTSPPRSRRNRSVMDDVKAIESNLQSLKNRLSLRSLHQASEVSCTVDTLKSLSELQTDYQCESTCTNAIQNSQLEVKVYDASKLKLPANEKDPSTKNATILSPRSMPINKALQISIETKNAGSNKVTADIKLNEQAVNFDLNKVNESKYELKLMPSKVGTYQVNVFLNGNSVSGSPFFIKIDSVSPNAAAVAPTVAAGDQIQPLPKQTVLPQIVDQSTSTSRPAAAMEAFKATAETPPQQPSQPQQFQQSNMITTSTSSGNNYRTELNASFDRSELVVGKEIKLSVKIVELSGNGAANGNSMQDYGKMNRLNNNDNENNKDMLDKVESKVKLNNRSVSHKLDYVSDGNYQLNFLPIRSGSYSIYFYKEGKLIEGSPFKLSVRGKLIKEIYKPNYAQVGIPYILILDYYDLSKIKANVFIRIKKDEKQTTNGSQYNLTTQSIQAVVEKSCNTKLKLKFIPLEPVEHIIDVTDNDVPIENFPLKIHVFPNKEIYMINESLAGVRYGQMAKFRICLNGQNDALDVRVTNIDHGSSQCVTFLLNEEYQHAQHIYCALAKFLKINPNRIQNRELTIENKQTRVSFSFVDGPNEQSNSYLLKELKNIINEEKYVIIDLSVQKTITAIKNSLKYAAKGENVALKMEKKSNGDYIGEFYANMVGCHRVDIENFGKPINDSPYFVNVYDPLSVHLIQMPNKFIVGSENSVKLDVSKAGGNAAQLSATIESPSGIVNQLAVDDKFIINLRLISKESGLHKLSILYGGNPIKNSPFELNFRPLDHLQPRVWGDGLFNGIQGKQTSFLVDLGAAFSEENLDVQIIDSNQKRVSLTKSRAAKDCNNLMDYSGKLVEIKYTPISVGPCRIALKYKSKELENSPYVAEITNPQNLKLLGEWRTAMEKQTVVNLDLNDEKSICFDLTESGLGNVTATILSPYSECLNYRRVYKDNLCKIFFTPVYEGEYKLNFFMDNVELAKEPVSAQTIRYSNLREIRVYGDGIKKADLNSEVEFFVDCTRVPNLVNEYPEVTFTGFSSDLNDLKISLVRKSDGIYKCSYVPEKPGHYLINVKYDSIHVPGSPFEIKIGMNPDPAKIKFNKDELKSPILGEEMKATIDTKNAGPGELTANCMGPQRAAFCEFKDQNDGTYLLYIKPQEAGKHILQIKYNGKHVPNSPYVIRVSTPPDENKVKIIGPGVCHGLLSDFKSKFFCETKGAGAGQLTVRVRGPKGAFRVDMQRESEKDRRIVCKYDPTEAGDYQISVKWSGKHVPGSPFNVKIFKSQDELDKYLQANPSEAATLNEKQSLFKDLNIE